MLLDLYRAKVSAHSVAANDMVLAGAKKSKKEYDHLWLLADKARAEAEAASLALFQHTREHGCQEWPESGSK
jgi:hypothetical protein